MIGPGWRYRASAVVGKTKWKAKEKREADRPLGPELTDYWGLAFQHVLLLALAALATTTNKELIRP